MRNCTPPLLLLLPVLLLVPLAPGAAKASDKPSQKELEKIAAARRAAKSLELLYQSIGKEVLRSVVQVLPSYGQRPHDAPATPPPPPTATPPPDDPLGAFEHFFSPPRGAPRNRGSGSGFVIDGNGAIVTSAHVVSDADSVYVRLHDGTVLEAKVVGSDKEIDLAVLRIPRRKALPVKWGDSSRLRPGSIVLAMGTPLGLHNSMSQGIVSGLERRGPRTHGSRVFIQTDAAINLGNSGGPLVNLDGEVVGINTWMIAPPRGGGGLGFAIPSNLARELVTRILSEGPDENAAKILDRAWAGVIPGRDTGRGPGVVLFHVLPDSPAADAGLRPSDRILAVNERRVETTEVLEAVLKNLRPEGTVMVEVDGRSEPVVLKLGGRPSEFEAAWRADEKPAPVEETPLGAIQRRRLREALIDRDCPCPCGRALYDCFGCSAAKSEFSEGEYLIRLGLSAKEISRRLDPPVLVLVWADYTDRAGRELLQTLDQLKRRYEPLIRVRRRYFPADGNSLDGWRQTINAIEIARAAGHYEAAHRLLVETKGDRWQKVVSQMPEVLGLDRDDFRRGIAQSRYEQQIRKDLTAGPTQYGVTRSPSLRINEVLIEEGLSLETIAEQIERAILAAAM